MDGKRLPKYPGYGICQLFDALLKGGTELVGDVVIDKPSFCVL